MCFDEDLGTKFSSSTISLDAKKKAVYGLIYTHERKTYLLIVSVRN